MNKKLIFSILFVIILIAIFFIFKKNEHISSLKEATSESKVTVFQNPSEIEYEERFKNIEISTDKEFIQEPIETEESEIVEDEPILYDKEF